MRPTRPVGHCAGRIDTLIEQQQAALASHADRTTRQPGNWGFAGDLASVERQLEVMVEAVRG